MDLFNYFRRETTEVNIGAVPLGGPNSIRVQSMTNTSTQDTQACVEQAKRIVDAGGEYVRLTTQGIKEAENLMNINIGLRSQGYMVPDWSKSWLSVRSYHVPLWRYPRRNGRVLHGVSPYLCRGKLHGCGDFHQGF